MTAPATATDGRPVDALFRSIQVHRMTLRNRIVMPPMGRFFAVRHVPREEYIEYFRRRAEGGAGLVIGEGGAVGPASLLDGTDPAYFGDEAVAVWQRVVEAVHAEGACFAPQLWHGGMARRAADSTRPDVVSVSPSGVFIRDTDASLVRYPSTVEGMPMTQAQIDAAVAEFGEAAATMQRIGADAVELHGGHGYLIDQFLWSETNRRTDRYGGSLVRRARFAAEVVAEVRRRTGPDFPILFRFSQWKVQDYDARIVTGPDELEKLLGPIVDAGADVLHCSTRRLWEPAFAGDGRTLAAWTRHVTGLPVIAVGSVGMSRTFGVDSPGASPTGIAHVAEMLDRGDFDLLSVGRGQIADPDWARLVAAGAFDRLHPYERSHLDELV